MITARGLRAQVGGLVASGHPDNLRDSQNLPIRTDR